MKDNKCPSCGGKLTYNPSSMSLTCEYCGSSFPIDKKAKENSKRDYTTDVTFKEVQKSQYLCESCGSHINFDGIQLVKRCPNCGSANLQKTTSVSFEPDGIVPFVIGADKAKVLFFEWIKKRKFAPNDLRKMAKMGKLSGFYTPVWNFDGTTNTTYHGYGVTEHRDKDGHTHSSRTYISGTQNSLYENILCSANKNINMRTFQKLGDWGLDTLQVYSMDYLCGFISTDVNIDIHNTYQTFTSYAKSSDASKIRAKYFGRYDRVEGLVCNTNVYNPKFNYIYLPLWANYYTYKTKKYSCYINGHSGMVTGSSPKSFWKIFFLVAGIVLGATLLAILIASIVNGSMSSFVHNGFDSDFFPDFSSNFDSDFFPDFNGF